MVASGSVPPEPVGVAELKLIAAVGAMVTLPAAKAILVLVVSTLKRLVLAAFCIENAVVELVVFLNKAPYVVEPLPSPAAIRLLPTVVAATATVDYKVNSEIVSNIQDGLSTSEKIFLSPQDGCTDTADNISESVVISRIITGVPLAQALSTNSEKSLEGRKRRREESTSDSNVQQDEYSNDNADYKDDSTVNSDDSYQSWEDIDDEEDEVEEGEINGDEDEGLTGEEDDLYDDDRKGNRARENKRENKIKAVRAQKRKDAVSTDISRLLGSTVTTTNSSAAEILNTKTSPVKIGGNGKSLYMYVF